MPRQPIILTGKRHTAKYQQSPAQPSLVVTAAKLPIAQIRELHKGRITQSKVRYLRPEGFCSLICEQVCPHSSDRGQQTFSIKGQTETYFWLCRPDSLSQSLSPTLAAWKHINEWMWLCSHKTKKTGEVSAPKKLLLTLPINSKAFQGSCQQEIQHRPTKQVSRQNYTQSYIQGPSLQGSSWVCSCTHTITPPLWRISLNSASQTDQLDSNCIFGMAAKHLASSTVTCTLVRVQDRNHSSRRKQGRN